jgi:hypothetical protein
LSELEKRGCYHREVLDVGLEEVAQSYKGSDCFDVSLPFVSP